MSGLRPLRIEPPGDDVQMLVVTAGHVVLTGGEQARCPATSVVWLFPGTTTTVAAVSPDAQGWAVHAGGATLAHCCGA